MRPKDCLQGCSRGGGTTGRFPNHRGGRLGRVPQLLGPDPRPVQLAVTWPASDLTQLAVQGPPLGTHQARENLPRRHIDRHPPCRGVGLAQKWRQLDRGMKTIQQI
jgi:hypothetical protein